MLTATMTAAEEARFAAAFRCVRCGARVLETWAEAEASRKKPRTIEEK
ncbi:MAG: hypothetical protein ACXVEF_24315 [Polyangiales bacterium]